MTNNRMYLKCSLCGEELYLAKYHPGNGWVPLYQSDLGSFLDKHSPCLVHGKPIHDRKIIGEILTVRYK